MTTLHTLRKLRTLILFFMLSLLVGCSGGLFGQKAKDPKGDGFHTVLPKQGTHVVIWGDHSTAVTQASVWLRRQGAIILDDSQLQQAFKEHHIHPNGTASDKARLLKVGRLIGSDLVVFLNVEKLLLVRGGNFVQAGGISDHVYDLEIQGVDVKTGKTVWQGHAKDSAPPQESEALLMNLTTFALKQAWNSPQEEIESYGLAQAEEIKTGHTETNPSSMSQENRLAKMKQTEIEHEDNSDTKRSSTSQEKLLTTKGKKIEIGVNDNSETTLSPIRQENQLTKVKENETGIEDHPKTKFRSISQETQLAKSKATQIGIEEQPETKLHSIRQEHIQKQIDRQKPEPINQNAAPSQEDDIGIQVASGGLSLLYCPAKLLYAGVGSVIGGFAYLLSGGNDRVADTIWNASLQGTYIIRPSHLRGDEPVYFMGGSQKKFATIHPNQNSLHAKDSVH